MSVGLGLKNSSQGHREETPFTDLLPTTTGTTTTTLFLPDSRARMRDRMQENKKKRTK